MTQTRKCKACGKGEMQNLGEVPNTEPVQHEYECSNCGVHVCEAEPVAKVAPPPIPPPVVEPVKEPEPKPAPIPKPVAKPVAKKKAAPKKKAKKAK